MEKTDNNKNEPRPAVVLNDVSMCFNMSKERVDSLKEYRLKADDAEKIKLIREYTESFKWEDVLGLIG